MRAATDASAIPTGEQQDQDELDLAHAGLRAKSLATLFLIGSLMLILSLLVMKPENPSRSLTAAGAGVAIALVVGLSGKRLPVWGLQLFLACGTLLIEWVIYGVGQDAATYTVFYFWIAIYAFQFFTPRQAAAQIGFIFFSYAVVLGLFDDLTSPEVLRWAVTTLALVVSGAMIGVLKNSNARLVDHVSMTARVDPLTGLQNRRGFDERFAIELARARRTGERMSLLIGDLDGFKGVNDMYGHQEGDRLLRAVGTCLSEPLRESDASARIGGEEFAVILPDTDEQGAYLAAERLRRVVAEACSELPGELTISIGVATFPQHGHEADTLMRAADQAVYMAKQLGRDRTVVYDATRAEKMAGAAREATPDHERQLATALRLAEALDVRDAGTAAHSQTVGRYAYATAKALGFSEENAERVRYAGIVHDVGKIGVPDEILCKPGALTDEEQTEMRKHPEIGARILSGSELSDISSWVIAHHERPDGNGYPLGLRGEEIPIQAQILAVADAYEGMTNDRVYRAALPPLDAQEELIRGIGRQFDARVVSAFLSSVVGEPIMLGPDAAAAARV